MIRTLRGMILAAVAGGHGPGRRADCVGRIPGRRNPLGHERRSARSGWALAGHGAVSEIEDILLDIWAVGPAAPNPSELLPAPLDLVRYYLSVGDACARCASGRA